MSAELLVVEGCILKASTGNTTQIVIAPPPTSTLASKIKCKVNSVFKTAYTSITFSVTHGSFVSPVNTLTGNTEKTKSEGVALINKSATISIILTGPNSTTESCNISIDAAGQTKVKVT